MIYIIAISKLSGRLGILTEQGESSQELQVVPFFRSVDKIQVAEVINKPEDTGNRGRTEDAKVHNPDHNIPLGGLRPSGSPAPEMHPTVTRELASFFCLRSLMSSYSCSIYA